MQCKRIATHCSAFYSAKKLSFNIALGLMFRKAGVTMKIILSIVSALFWTLPVQGEMSTARRLQLLDMRTRQLKPYSGPDVVVSRGAFRHFRYSYRFQTARQVRQDRRWRQNRHRRAWQYRRDMHRWNRSIYRP